MRETIHPGETLCEDIDALGISASQLARHIELPMNRITQYSTATARSREIRRFFGTSGEFWLNLQKIYELRLAERKHSQKIARLATLEPVGPQL